MAFPKKLLADHEKLVFDIRPHWLSLVPPILWIVVFATLWILGHRMAGSQFDGSAQTNVQKGVAVLCLALILYFGIFPMARWATTHFVLTSDRLITRSGVIGKHSREMPLERINDVAFTQTAIERFLGSGDLMIESAGERGQSRITNVRKPEQVQLMIYKETESNNNRMMSGGQREETVMDQLEALGRLRESGTITEEEFETKKQELLKRL
ncbi:MAG: PH domain-containing protein [Actinomycetota bacterium]